MYNAFTNNTSYAISVFNEGHVHHNNFFFNNPDGRSQAYCSSLVTKWYDSSTLEGNYWSDWDGEVHMRYTHIAPTIFFLFLLIPDFSPALYGFDGSEQVCFLSEDSELYRMLYFPYKYYSLMQLFYFFLPVQVTSQVSVEMLSAQAELMILILLTSTTFSYPP